jgi:hypothetical protein
MLSVLARTAALVLAGALAGALSLIVTHGPMSGPELDMDRSVSAVARGIYGLERSGDYTFAWTSERAEITLPGLDRRVPWVCDIRLRGARPAPHSSPDVTVRADGVVVVQARTSNEISDLRAAIPARPEGDGLTLTIVPSSIFVPGPSDRRTLGVQLDRVACAPEQGGGVRPPRPALVAAAVSSAILAAAVVLIGLPAWAAAVWAVVVAAAQAQVLSAGLGSYSPLPAVAVPLAAWIAAVFVIPTALIAAATRRRVDIWTALALAVTVAFLFLKLLALFHPQKAVVDALFHAHRFERVLAGHFYFTQLSTSGTPFPYAVGLYAFSTLWAPLTRDHMALLRVVVCAWEAAAGLLLYWAVVRQWRDGRAGAVAVLLFSLVPLPYAILGNANLTNAFGNAVSIAAALTVALWADRAIGRRWPLGVWALLATLGFTSHISTLVLLPATLGVVGALFIVAGGPTLRRPGWAVIAATGAGLALAVMLYWGHFGDVYRQQLTRAREAAPATAHAPAPPDAASVADEPAARAGLGRRELTVGERAGNARHQIANAIGWPILVLAIAGLWPFLGIGVRNPLSLVVVGWVLSGAVFVLLAIVAPGNIQYQQDAWEFIGRVLHATYPAVVLLAALGVAWAFRAGAVPGTAGGLLIVGAVLIWMRAWRGWLP